MKGYVTRQIDLFDGKCGTAYIPEDMADKFDRLPSYTIYRLYLAHKIVDQDGKVIKDLQE